VLAVLLLIARALPEHDGFVLLGAGILGIVTFVAVEGWATGWKPRGGAGSGRGTRRGPGWAVFSISMCSIPPSASMG
jgi:hypothetical protein